MKVGIALIIVFGANLIFSLFFSWPGESIADRIPAIIFSSLMIAWGVWRVRGHMTKASKGMKVGIVLIIGFGINLVFRLYFLFSGESIADRIPAIIFSSLMIAWGVWLARGHYGKRRVREAGSTGEPEQIWGRKDA